jgi:hypothetical protein
MKRMLIALMTVVVMVCIGIGGIVYGQKITDERWASSIVKATLALEMGTYRMAWTNTRACVLAVDSAAMRFVVAPTPEDLSDLRNRYEVCESHWELLDKYTPDAQSKSSLTRARWEFNNWWGQLEEMIRIQVKMMVAQNAGDMETASGFYDMLIEHRGASRRYRDRIEAKLFEAW